MAGVQVCVFTAPLFSSLCALAAFLLVKEIRGQGAGLCAAAFMGLIPSYISRSVAGSYDLEGVAIFALVFTFYLYIKVPLPPACRQGWRNGLCADDQLACRRSTLARWPGPLPTAWPTTIWCILIHKQLMKGNCVSFHLAAGHTAKRARAPPHPFQQCPHLTLLQVASWGGYTFIINLLPIHCLACVFTGQLTAKLYIAFAPLILIGTIEAGRPPPLLGLLPLCCQHPETMLRPDLAPAASIPVIGFNAVLMSEHFGSFFALAVLHAALAIQYIKVGPWPLLGLEVQLQGDTAHGCSCSVDHAQLRER